MTQVQHSSLVSLSTTLDMSLVPVNTVTASNPTDPQRTSGSSRFEQVIANNPPVLRSLIAQLPTQSIFDLYHTSHFLGQFLRESPTSWRYMSWRLHQPSTNSGTTTTQTNTGGATAQQRQSGSYALDQLLFNLVIPFSTRLTSLVLDNTSVSGATLFSAVMILRKDTLEHVSVRGCKNVSLKYHVNPWLAMHAMAVEQSPTNRPPCFQGLALKSLYTYRCRHHRRRPYLPASLNRKESDSEPTHELVLTCHKLGIWTDTAWCTTPGPRCYRRRGYVNMRPQQDLREVWVVFDRLWRSRNWLGSPPSRDSASARARKRKRDGRFWEEEEGVHGEAVGLGDQGKHIPMHQRQSHRRFVENVSCDNCAEPITERCEQCSVMMHCFGCRKTLCASCAFDRPYLRNVNASDEDRQRFWWAPGAAVSPCCMQDTDPVSNPAQPHAQIGSLPNIKFRWCCTEPVFSGGGGITLAGSQTHDEDPLRAAPLPIGQGFEDAEFATHHAEDCPEIGSPLSRATVPGPGGRWNSLAEMFRYGVQMNLHEDNDTVPRMLCHECHSSDQWRIKCKSCSVALCLKHDVKEKQRVRICGYKELSIEKQELINKLKATKVFKTLLLKRKEQQKKEALDAKSPKHARSEAQRIIEEAQIALAANVLLDDAAGSDTLAKVNSPHLFPTSSDRPMPLPLPMPLPIRIAEPTTETELLPRPLSPGSNSTGPMSRDTSPAPSTRSTPAAPESSKMGESSQPVVAMPSTWRGCQSFYCPASRPSGDHRRRCSSVMRQCLDCKVLVCDDCVADLDKPCPCQGCRLPPGETDPISGGMAAFYCPNCRHDRILTRKCRRRPACLTRSRSMPVRKERNIKSRMTPQEKFSHIADFLLDPNAFPDDFTLDSFFTGVDQELQELQEISMTAVSVVRRVQNLRSQAPPGSPAAIALPNIIIEGIDEYDASSISS